MRHPFLAKINGHTSWTSMPCGHMGTHKGHPCGTPKGHHFQKLITHILAKIGSHLFVVAPCAPIGHTSWASMGTPMGHPYGYPIGHPFLGSTSFSFLLRAPSGPLMGTPMGHPYGYPIGHPFLGSTSLNYCPFGAGMYVCEVPPGSGRHAAHTYFRSVPLRDFFSLRAPSGPLMGTLWAPMWAPLWGTHFQK